MYNALLFRRNPSKKSAWKDCKNIFPTNKYSIWFTTHLQVYTFIYFEYLLRRGNLQFFLQLSSYLGDSKFLATNLRFFSIATVKNNSLVSLIDIVSFREGRGGGYLYNRVRSLLERNSITFPLWLKEYMISLRNR